LIHLIEQVPHFALIGDSSRPEQRAVKARSVCGLRIDDPRGDLRDGVGDEQTKPVRHIEISIGFDDVVAADFSLEDKLKLSAENPNRRAQARKI